MENFGHSSNILSDFEFKCIPKMELQKVMRKVQNDKKQRRSDDNVRAAGRQVGMWGNYCTAISSIHENDEDENLTPHSEAVNEVHAIYYEPQLRSIAPLFGPSRKLDIQTLKKFQGSKRFADDDRNIAAASHSSNSSVHIVEEVNVADVQKSFDAKIQVQENITNDADVVSQCSSDNDETLHSEMLELCNQIEKVNGSNSSTNDKILNQRDDEEKKKKQQLSKNIMNKTENEFASNYIDKKFDFLYENFENFDDLKIEQQSLSSFNESLGKKTPATKKNEKCDDSTNDNNVYIPKMPNQMSKNEKQQRQQRHGDENSSVKKKRNVISPSESHKAQNAVASDVLTNEKSQAAESAHFIHVMGKVTAYQEKICQYIERLREIIIEPPLLEDINDLNKRQRRATEFTNRLVRNHIFPIGRLTEEVRLMPDNPMEVATKVNLLFQAIMQAIQVYLKNLEMFIYNSNPDKLSVLVNSIINASKICFDRKLFDKQNVVVVKMLRKSVEMNRLLELNKNSVAKFESATKRRDLRSRNSYSYGETSGKEKPSIYGGEIKTKRTSLNSKSPYDAPKTPYDIPVQRKTSKQSIQSRQRAMPPTHRNTPAMKARSPGVRKSISNISTMVQKEVHVGDVEEEEEAQPQPSCQENKEETILEIEPAEKPLEENQATNCEQIEKPKEATEIMEMLHNIAKEKFQEIFATYISDLVPKSIEIPTRVTDEIKPPRVTSDIKPQKPITAESTDSTKTASSVETVQRIAPNIQYLFVQSNNYNDSEETLKAEQSDEKLSLLLGTPSSTTEEPKTKVVTSILKPSLRCDDIAKDDDDDIEKKEKNSDDEDDFLHRKDDEKTKKLKQMAMNERKVFAESMIENPLYVNEQYEEPWNMFRNASDVLINEMLKTLISEFDLGEKALVENFFKHELAC